MESENIFESIAAFVNNEQELRDTIVSEADGLIVICGSIKVNVDESLELCEGQSLVGLSYVGKEGKSELIFWAHEGIKILKMADHSMLADLKVRIEKNKYLPGEALIEVNGKKAVRLKNLRLELSQVNNENSSLLSFIRLNDVEDFECLGEISFYGKGHGIKGFEVSRNSRLNFRGNLVCGVSGKDNYAIYAENGALVNIFSGAVIDIASCSVGISNDDGTVNIFGGAKFKSSGQPIWVNQTKTNAGFFIYKNSEVLLYDQDKETPVVWRARNFNRIREEQIIDDIEVLGNNFRQPKSSYP